MIPKPVRDDSGRVQGDFYPLQKQELIALRKSKLINNAAFVHLALRYENPFCNRSIVVIPKEFALRWEMPESSVYEAIAKLKEQNSIAIRAGKITIEWATDSQQAPDSENPEKLRNPRKNSGTSEKILESQKKLRNPRKNSGTSENRDSKPLSDKDSGASKINKTYKDFKDSLSNEEKESFLKFGEEMSKQLPKPPQLVTKWIAANWEEIKEKWLKSTNKPSEQQTYKWADHPNREEWLEIINTRGTGIFVFENDDQYEERNQFLDWAVKENLVKYE